MFRKLRNIELNRPSLQEYKSLQKINVRVLLNNLRSMHNIGSVFRTSDAFLIEKIYLCGITAKPPHKEIRKTSLGAEESVPFEYFDKAIDALNKSIEEGYIPMAIEQSTQSTYLNNLEIKQRGKYLLIFGNEVDGVEQALIEKCKAVIEIPQSGTKHSVNVSVACAIILWEFYKNMK